MINLGTYSLSGAVLASALGVLLAVAAGVLEKPSLLGPARWMLAMVAALITSASAALLQALVQSDFTIAYVASYTERALPLGYKLAAFWAGQAGSLLFWTWALSLMALVAAFAHKRRTAGEHAAMLGTLAAVGLFFCTLMLFAVNPFDPTPIVVRDGNGLNPLLQNPAMIAHPPILFLGYAGFTIPFALLIGALVADRRDAGWMIQARRWLLGSWLFLTVGILLGAWWAYVELGWGGYWAWDPVENASLLPWLTATAVLHSIMIQQQRGMFRIWNAAFIAATFLLCVFATYLTRSGIVQSVHSFGQSPIGWFFLSFLVLGVLVVAGLMIARRRTLAGDRPLESVVNREGAFLAGNVLFLIIMLTTMIGTIFPVLSELFTGRAITVGQPFYNSVVVPMGLALVALMVVGPLLGYGAQATGRVVRGSMVPAFAGLAAVGAAAAMGLAYWQAWISVFVVVFGFVCIGAELIRAVRAHAALSGTGMVGALVPTLVLNRRRYGAQTAHIGVLLIVVGVAGSGLFQTEQDLQLEAGQSHEIGRYSIQLDSIHEHRRGHYTAIVAVVHATDPKGGVTTLRPEKRFYDKTDQPNSEVDIRYTWRDDLYVALAGWQDGGRVVALTVIINPLVSWIWIGTAAMTLGGLICLLPFPGVPRPAAVRVGLPMGAASNSAVARAAKT